MLLDYVNEKEDKKLIEEFHVGECGGHHYWKATVNKIMRVGFYWLAIFFDTHKKVNVFHKCQLFEGRRKLLPFPLKPIQVESPFQQWGIDFDWINKSTFLMDSRLWTSPNVCDIWNKTQPYYLN